MLKNYIFINYSKNIFVYRLRKNLVLVKGRLGYFYFSINPEFFILVNNSKNLLFVSTYLGNRHLFAFKTFFLNKLDSIQKGFSTVVQIKGFGYKTVEIFKKKQVNFFLGYSHPIIYKIPKYINLNILNFKGTLFNIFSFDRGNISNTFLLIKKFKKFNSYNSKGIFLNNKKVVLKKIKRQLS